MTKRMPVWLTEAQVAAVRDALDDVAHRLGIGEQSAGILNRGMILEALRVVNAVDHGASEPWVTVDEAGTRVRMVRAGSVASSQASRVGMPLGHTDLDEVTLYRADSDD